MRIRNPSIFLLQFRLGSSGVILTIPQICFLKFLNLVEGGNEREIYWMMNSVGISSVWIEEDWILLIILQIRFLKWANLRKREK